MYFKSIILGMMLVKFYRGLIIYDVINM